MLARVGREPGLHGAHRRDLTAGVGTGHAPDSTSDLVRHGRHGAWPNLSPGGSSSGTPNASALESPPTAPAWRGSRRTTKCSMSGPPRSDPTGSIGTQPRS